jgi:lipopolysaccharide assembly protein A
MQIYLLISLVIAIIAVIFALQNMTTVTISFLFWSIKGSLALVLLITLAAGVLISALASLPGFIGGKWSNTSQRKKLSSLEAERNLYKQRAETAEKDVKDLEEQLANLSADYDQGQSDLPDQPDQPSLPS